MTDPKTRFQKVSLEDLKKIFPEVVDGNHNHTGNQKDKKKNKRKEGTTSKPKAKA